MLVAALACLHGPARPALAQGSPRPWGRIAFFTTSSQITSPDTPSRGYSEFVTSATYRSPELDTAGAEYALDMRAAGYTIEGRDPRVSLYEAWAGVNLAGGAWRVRGGQMWLNDLGALGSVAGGAVEYRRKLRVGRVRFGGFGGLEPKTFETGYVPDVKRSAPTRRSKARGSTGPSSAT